MQGSGAPSKSIVPSGAPHAAPLRLGPRLEVWPPVVLAPMAGVTNWPYRKICARMGAGLCVSEMVSSRGILDGHRGTLRPGSIGRDTRVGSPSCPIVRGALVVDLGVAIAVVVPHDMNRAALGCDTPGIIETTLSKRIRDEHQNELLDDIAARRFGKPEEVAAVISFLASPEAGYINGQVIRVDGGMGL